MKKLIAMLLAIICVLGSVGIMANAEDISAEPIVANAATEIPVDASGMLITTGKYSAGVFYYDVSVKKFFYLDRNVETFVYADMINPYTGVKGCYNEQRNSLIFPTAVYGNLTYSLRCPRCNYMFGYGSIDDIMNVYNDPENGNWPGRFRRHDKCDVDITEDDIWAEYNITGTDGVISVYSFSVKASENTLENFRLKMAEHQDELNEIVTSNAKFYEEHKEDPAPQDPSKPWYQFIIDFFVSIINFFKNLFG